MLTVSAMVEIGEMEVMDDASIKETKKNEKGGSVLYTKPTYNSSTGQAGG